jgi:hypothetical protein|nr:MAG TPA: hypothetical protein [Bacteriophage sp.]
MEIKVLFEIEKESRKVIENFSKALAGLENNPVQNIAVSVAGKIKEPEKVETEIKTGDWQTNDVKVEPEKKEETPVKNVETPKEEEPKKAEDPATETQGWSYDQLKAGCHEASTMNLGSKVAELIKGKYNLSKLTELDPKLYDAFANDLRELGVRI